MLEVGVIGVPHEKSGEVVKACVVKKDDSLTPEELIAFCREKLTGYKIPKACRVPQRTPEIECWKDFKAEIEGT